jgi:hypothetical protein
MSNFKKLVAHTQSRFATMQASGALFKAKVEGKDLWELYLKSFKEGDDPVYLHPHSTHHTCGNDRNFINAYGNIVAIVDGKLMSIWGGYKGDDEYKASSEALDEAITASGLSGFFMEDWENLNNTCNYSKVKRNDDAFQLGFARSLVTYTRKDRHFQMKGAFIEHGMKFNHRQGIVDGKLTEDIVTVDYDAAGIKFNDQGISEVVGFDHFHLMLDKKYMMFDGSAASKVGVLNTNHQLFVKGISVRPEAVATLARLIKEDKLWELKAEDKSNFSRFEKAYAKHNKYTDPVNHPPLSSWSACSDIAAARFINTNLGDTLQAINDGENEWTVIGQWNHKVDPSRYKVTQEKEVSERESKQAKEAFDKLGYTEDSFMRRMATREDISVSDRLRTDPRKVPVKAMTIFDKVSVKKPEPFDLDKARGIKEVSACTFMEDILPSVGGIEVLFENKAVNNLFILTAPQYPDAKPIIKGESQLSLTYYEGYSGKTQSAITKAVAKQGGKIEGAMRGSLSWSQNNGDDSDLDLHCKESSGYEIYFSNRNQRSPYGGTLDVDHTSPLSMKESKEEGGVTENIVYPKLVDGVYNFCVQAWTSYGSKGFKFELVMEDCEFHYSYDKPLTQYKENVLVVTVTIKGGIPSYVHHLKPTILHNPVAKEVWGITSSQFHPCHMVFTSPTQWGENEVGTKDYLFAIEGCGADKPMRAFHTACLNNELSSEKPMRRYMELLGQQLMVEPSDNQISGLGFNSVTRANNPESLVVRVQEGSTSKLYKINF